ncbi:hypothetical protein L596_016477 [Steinernema carpocapsae]|uniref:Uncharacterized protein n=1 Tax=Steinernema carpocapsae TaxID=34508 RepID=A0A4U5NI70_STECR|nr:hypothetical protein L596_016477 [Steinernema carpocapsae]
MADEVARKQQYAYSSSANLVVNIFKRSRNRDEPRGFAENLPKEMLASTKMGDKYQRTKAPKVDKNKKKKSEANVDLDTATLTSGDVTGSYKPRTQETRQTYDVILNLLKRQLGEQSDEIIHGAGDEVLEVFKSETLQESLKKVQIESLLGKMADEKFSLLMNLAKKITDFIPAEEALEQEGDGDIEDSINVQFDEEDDDADDQGVAADFAEGNSDVEENELLQAGGFDQKMDEEQAEVRAKDIDAYWIQRRLAQVHTDPLVAQRKVDEILVALSKDCDDRACENELCSIIGFDLFDSLGSTGR